jgi:hypothetical protein
MKPISKFLLLIIISCLLSVQQSPAQSQNYKFEAGRNSIKVLPGVIWNTIGFEHFIVPKFSIHISGGICPINAEDEIEYVGISIFTTVLDFRYYPVFRKGAPVSEKRRIRFFPYAGLGLNQISFAGRVTNIGPGLVVGTRLRCCKRLFIDMNVGGTAVATIRWPDYNTDNEISPILPLPRASLSFGWVLGKNP